MQLFSNAFTELPSVKAFIELLLMLATDPLMVVLFALLTIAAVSDCRSFRIPNWLTMGGTLFALAYSVIFPSVLHPDFFSALGGCALGLVLMLPLYALKVMGAGDAKLMAMTGAFLGVSEVWQAVIVVFIVGGVAAFAFALYRKALRKMLGNLKSIINLAMLSAATGGGAGVHIQAGATIGRMPYGLSICVGTIGYVLARQFGYL